MNQKHDETKERKNAQASIEIFIWSGTAHSGHGAQLATCFGMFTWEMSTQILCKNIDSSAASASATAATTNWTNKGVNLFK